MAEPGQLPLGIPAGRLLERRRAACQVGLSLKIRKKLLIADGLGRRAVGCAVRIHPARLFKQAGRHHTVHPAVNAAVKGFPVTVVKRQAERAVGRGFRPGGGARLAHTAAGGAVQFQRPDHPRQVVRVDRRRIVGVGGLQFGKKRGRAPFRLGPCFERGAQIRVGLFRRKGRACQQIGDVQPGAPRHNRQFPGCRKRPDDPIGPGCEISDAERRFGFHNIQQVVRHAPLLFRCGLGCADVEPFIYLHRIGAEHFAPKPFGQRDGEGCFAGGGGPADSHNDGARIRQDGQTVFPAPSG